ncbi:hypothetical protein [Micromonospora zamorensis]|uniref:hypothetical protein n=1 Tax=Micromonospora zamorensis TaxID=709883 RepID=UPI0033EAE602
MLAERSGEAVQSGFALLGGAERGSADDAAGDVGSHAEGEEARPVVGRPPSYRF